MLDKQIGDLINNHEKRYDKSSGMDLVVFLATLQGKPTIIKIKEESLMVTPEEMWQCQTVNCGYIYNPDKGDRKGKIPKGIQFEDLPEDWKCPICGASKKMFKPLAGEGSVAAGA